ncbi:MAG: hypothetical protein WED10_09465 [Brumimicrobium sp.]
MIQYYQTLKAKTGYCRFTNDDSTFLAHIFEDSIQDIDIGNTSDLEFKQLIFPIPVITNKELFQSSQKKEGFKIKPVRLASIRRFDWLKDLNSI